MNAHEQAAARFIAWLETGDAHPELFTPDVFLDASFPCWREQAQGRVQAIALRRVKHPCQGKVTRHRLDATASGFVLELEEQWQDGGEQWYARELFRADLDGESISNLAAYCTGDWDTARRAEHAREVRLLRP